MTFTPILETTPAIQLHVICALAALGLTPFIMFGRKGTARHKVLGRAWVAMMACTALSSFAISEIRLIGPFSPIHALSLVTLYSLWQAVRFARQRRIAAHRQAIQGAAAGLVGAGLFTFLPGRLMAEITFGAYEVQGFVTALAVCTLGCAVWWVRARRMATTQAAQLRGAEISQK